ncbi:MAG: NTP transferase domain-containing protein [Endozoicomonadaceae bacterium]|nr:NTP transferase domain-containing protein [Endozoicomonadaceae bacterium]
MNFSIIIPAGFSSSKLSMNPLFDLNGTSILQHVYEIALKSCPDNIIIATNDERIASLAKKIGAIAHITLNRKLGSISHLQEVIHNSDIPIADILITLPCNMPFMPLSLIKKMVSILESKQDISIAALSCMIKETEASSDPNIIKVIPNAKNNILYLSRATIPYLQDEHHQAYNSPIYHQLTDLHAYRLEALNQFDKWPESPLETAENIELLRFLWYGYDIHHITTNTLPPSINNEQDLDKVVEYLNNPIQSN